MRVQLDLSFDVEQIIVLSGKNGIGKSLLIDYISENQLLLTDKKLSFAFQDRLKSLWDYSVKDLLEIYKQADTLFEENKVYGQYSSLSVTQLESLKISSLSGGEVQKLKLFLALNRKCDLFILDEPFVHLDTKSQLELKSFLTTTTSKFLIVDHTDVLQNIGCIKEIVVNQGVLSEL